MKKKEDLPNKIPIFPLSNFIIFPETSVPLNIFEPKYIEMVDDIMKSSRMIGMIQPKKKTNNEIKRSDAINKTKRIKVENQNILNIRTVDALTRAEGPNSKKTQMICNLWYCGRINVTLGQIKIK